MNNHWYPNSPPIYDIEKTYAENVENGPFFDGDIPERVFPPEEEWIDFLGFRIASPLGVPAGPLLTANWVGLAARLGFDVLTYKTIRSRAYPAHPLPNMIYVDAETKLQRPLPSSNIEELAVTNSFGMPSMAPDFLQVDIPRANASLKKGQIMIVSVVGTKRQDNDFGRDFVDAALLAKECGAKIIEANFSCPNVDKSDGCLYMSEETVFSLTSLLTKALKGTPLILKMGTFANYSQMKSALIAAARAGARAVCGINTVSMAIVNQQGLPALGENRLTSGVCGGPIRGAALAFLHDAAKIISQEKLDLTLMGVGGITLPEHFDLFLEAGAQVALTATGMMWDPYLGAKYHEKSYTQVT